MIIDILAVLKCDCLYAYLDGGVILEKSLSHIFNDSQAPSILRQEKFVPKVLSFAGPTDMSCLWIVLVLQRLVLKL
jgi:hypothetical protein